MAAIDLNDAAGCDVGIDHGRQRQRSPFRKERWIGASIESDRAGAIERGRRNVVQANSVPSDIVGADAWRIGRSKCAQDGAIGASWGHPADPVGSIGGVVTDTT